MAINYDLWGAPNQWETLNETAGIKSPKTDSRSYYNAFYNSIIPLPVENIDKSLAFWGIGKGSIANHPMYLAPYWDNDTLKTQAQPVNENVTDSPAIFSYLSDPSHTPSIDWGTRYYPNVDDEKNIDIRGLSSAGIGSPLVSTFFYQSIVLTPYVRIGYTTPDSGGFHFITTTLKDFVDNKSTTYASYGKITAIGYKLAYGAGVSSNRDTGRRQLGLLHFLNVGGSTATYQATSSSRLYSWFATEHGFKTITADNASRSIHYITPYYELTAEDYNSLHTIGDGTTAINYRYCKNYYAGGNIYRQVYLYYYDPNNNLWQINTETNSTGYALTFPYINVTDDNLIAVRDYVLSQIAFLGLPFVYDPENAARGQVGNAGFYLPKFNNKGITTGEYEEGDAALSLPNSQWVDGRESGYEPEGGGDDDGDTGNLNNFPTYQNRYANSNAVYALDESNFIKFVGDVNNLYLTDADDTQMKLDFKGSNPNDYIIGVYGIPFLCNYVVPSGNDESFNLGPVPLPTAKGKKVDTSTTLMRDCGTVTIPAKGNFLDYEPYTQIELYIPMCGTIQLDCAQVVGRTLHVIVHYDITTMACVGCVYRDAVNGETLIHTINGTIGASLPLTSARMGDYQNSVQTTKNALKQNEMRTALGVGGAVIGIAGAALAPETGGLSLALAGAAIGGLATAASGAMTEKQLQYDLTHKQPALSQCSAADGMTAQLVSDLRPWIFIKRAKKLASYDAETYGKTVGFACCINSTVGAFSGFTVYSNVDLSGIPATKTEIDMIRAKLNSGVYI